MKHPPRLLRSRPVLLAWVFLLTTLASSHAQQRSIDDFFGDFTAEWVRMNPDQATQTRYFTGPEQDALETQLTPQTREWRERRVALASRGLAELNTFARGSLTELQRVSADLMRWQLDIVVEGQKYEDFAFPLEQFAGANINLVNTLTIIHPLNTEKDAVNYVARLGHVATRMGEATAEASELAGKGMLPPRFILETTLTQMRQFIGTPACAEPFRGGLCRSNGSGGVDSAGPPRCFACAGGEHHCVADLPGLARAIEVLQPLVARATDDAGLWRFKGGDEVYAYQLRRFTSTNLTADEIHQIGSARGGPDRRRDGRDPEAARP